MQCIVSKLKSFRRTHCTLKNKFGTERFTVAIFLYLFAVRFVCMFVLLRTRLCRITSLNSVWKLISALVLCIGREFFCFFVFRWNWNSSNQRRLFSGGVNKQCLVYPPIELKFNSMQTFDCNRTIFVGNEALWFFSQNTCSSIEFIARFNIQHKSSYSISFFLLQDFWFHSFNFLVRINFDYVLSSRLQTV